MTSRIAAAVLGLIAGFAAFLALAFSWGGTLSALRLDHAALLGGVTGAAQAAWTVAGGVAAFAVAASLTALIGGMAEVARLRRRIDELRLDPAMAGKWNAADWRAAFAPTAIADQAEAMIAVMPVERGEERRVVVDAPLLLGLSRLWLDRLMLTWTIRPLPPIVLSLSATLALFALGANGNWESALAAGTTGALVILVVQYLVRIVLSPLVDGAVAGATAAIRPLMSVHALEANRMPQAAAATPKRIEQEEAEIIAAALSNVIWEPLTRLADTVEKLTRNSEPAATAALPRDQEIEEAMVEIRAGIEKLLNNSGE